MPDPEQPPSSHPSAAAAGTILVVDDDETVRNISRLALQRAGYQVLVAGDAREALRVWETSEREPDALVSDVMMPEIDGVQLANELLAREPGLRVLMISGYADDATLPSRIRAAGHSFLAKPFLPGDLLDAVGDLLRPGARKIDGNGTRPEIGERNSDRAARN